MRSFILVLVFISSMLPSYSATLIRPKFKKHAKINYDISLSEQIIQIEKFKKNSDARTNRVLRIVFTKIPDDTLYTKLSIHSGDGSFYVDIFEILGAPISGVFNGKSAHYILISGLRPKAALMKASLELVDNNGTILDTKPVLFNFIKQELFSESEACIQKLSCASFDYDEEETIYHLFENPCLIGGGIETENTSLCEN
jgi:hypothetical protein